jgi:hypothetical protein
MLTTEADERGCGWNDAPSTGTPSRSNRRAQTPPDSRDLATDQKVFAEGGRCKGPGWARVRDGPLSVRARPSSIKHDCARRTTSTDGRCPVNVHAKSRLTLEPNGRSLRTLRPEDKGQAGACPDRTRAIPCAVPRQLRICPAIGGRSEGSTDHDPEDTERSWPREAAATEYKQVDHQFARWGWRPPEP